MATPRINLTERKTQKGTSYFLDYRLNGKRIRIPADKKSDAEIMRLKLQTGFNLSIVGIQTQNRNTINLEDLTEEYFDEKIHHVKPRTMERYKQLKERIDSYFKVNFLAACPDIRMSDVKYLREFVDELSEGGEGVKALKKKTVNNIMVFVKSIFKYAIENHYLKENLTYKLKEFLIAKKGKIEFYSDEGLKLLFNNIDKHWLLPIKFIASHRTTTERNDLSAVE
jgi:integrase